MYDIVFIVDDLTDSVSYMANDKALGLGDLSCELYKELWDTIIQKLLHFYQEVLQTNSLGIIINKGDIKFIPKPRDLEVITNWCLIILVNIKYKIISKDLALHLQPHLPLIIKPN